MANSKQIVYLSQSQYAELIANGTITVNGVTVTYDENDIYVTPQAEPVTDVRVAGTSVAANGVADIPLSNGAVAGTVRTLSTNQLGINVRKWNNVDGYLTTVAPLDNQIKGGVMIGPVISPGNQEKSTFYGLAKVAGHDEKNSTEPLGTYTPEAKGAIQQMLGVPDLIAPAENTLVASKAYAIGDVFTANGKLYKATAAIAANDTIVLQNSGETVSGANAVETSVGEGFVKFTDYAYQGNVGVVKIANQYGIDTNPVNGTLLIKPAASTLIKNPTGTESSYKPIVPNTQHESAFYGLAKAAGDITQSASSNAVGTYTDNAKASIKAMLGIQDGSTGTVDVSGTTPTITAVENTRYVCGEVTSLSFTPPASGISIVRFTSGSTVTVLTIPSTVKFPEWFDPTTLETNTIYEICVTDGMYGAVMSWAL